uniref:NADH-ubiquinone oxidoreductase chain 4 n=1 Tax=Dopasia harti TaxID=102193 RepID=U3M896_9SAUR|nr:NADH dehydrogenase subunit 4 [Dopasia harti]AGV03082.1 NADH dehydrogenase subunit 4 [Dopasia harti]AHG30994.1 NADH dehydrogenase subunit 4 [Dopasia harti]
MLKILIPTMMLIPASLILNLRLLFTSYTLYSTLIAMISLTWLKYPMDLDLSFSNKLMFIDPLSAPLLVLSCWLLPLMTMASQSHLHQEPPTRKRMYLLTLATLQTFLIMTFSASDLTMFYIMFEATLIPTLVVITRWGHQAERLSAGTYFLFYTLAGSLPLLIAILHFNKSLLLTFMPMLHSLQPELQNSWSHTALWYSCLLAFMVKMPMYGLHLWLPKAHVEAPIAGSMVLAAVLLKLGGYGVIRISTTLFPLTNTLAYPFLILALWGILMASSICLRQTDLKSMIAYSSVSHMGLVICATLVQTQWSLNGAIFLMIAHGLTSSMLFCLANTNYERTNSRTLLLTRGLHIILPLMTSWWLLASLANLALPPSINLMGELLIISSMFNWANTTIILTGLGTLLTASYSLFMFLMTQRGKLPTHLTINNPTHTREHLLMALHLIPLILLTAKPELFTSICP